MGRRIKINDFIHTLLSFTCASILGRNRFIIATQGSIWDNEIQISHITLSLNKCVKNTERIIFANKKMTKLHILFMLNICWRKFICYCVCLLLENMTKFNLFICAIKTVNLSYDCSNFLSPISYADLMYLELNLNIFSILLLINVDGIWTTMWIIGLKCHQHALTTLIKSKF